VRRGLSILLLAFAVPAAAAAHVTAVPAFVPIGAERVVELHAPNERREAPMTAFSLTAPTGVELLEALPAGAWRGTVDGPTATWTGGRLGPMRVGVLRARMRAEGEPRAVKLVAVQRFADGAGVRWDVDLTIVPGEEAETPSQHLGRALVVLLVGAVVIGGSLVVLHRTRR
jgi:uncharacterized protein YcnI